MEPKKEFPLRNKWEVKQRNPGTNFLTEETHLVGEFYPQRMRMVSNTDLHYLMSGKVITGYSEEEAKDIAREKNLELKKELEDKMMEQDLDRKLTYEERIEWFVTYFYESGMEYELLLVSMKDDDLDNFKWIGGEIISFPSTVRELKLCEREQ